MSRSGRFELWFQTRRQLRILSWVVVSAKYRHDRGATLDRPTLFSALEQVVSSHAALASRIDNAQSPPAWVRLPSVDLDEVVEFRDEDAGQLQTFLETFYAGPIQVADAAPLWKLFVLRDGTLSFAFDHSIGDGQSGYAFHAALLSALRNQQESPSAHSGILSDFPEDAALAPSMEESVDVSVPFTVSFKEILKAVWPPMWWKVASSWTGNPVSKTVVSGGMNVRILRYSLEETRLLTELSRSHKTTLTGTLHTLSLVVLSPLIKAQPDGARYKSIVTTIPISLRRFTGTPPGAFCNHFSSLQEHHPLLPLGADGAQRAVSAEGFPWDRAAALSEALKRHAPHSAYAVGLLKFIDGKYERFFLAQLGKKRAGGLEISNLGRFPAERVAAPADGAGTWNVDETLFSQADNTLSSAIVMSVAGGGDGSLGLTISWAKDAVDDAFGEAFVVGFKAGVQGLLTLGAKES
ncbi:alcohol acetyltransferase [Trametes elegans]|nr:alcohol acetyltransferase [Trametes elegans]